MTRSRAGRRAAAATLAVGLLVLVVALLAGGGRSQADGAATGTPTALPQLGALDSHAVLMGAATAGESGEAWAYRSLPVDVPQLPDPSGDRTFGPPHSAQAPGSQLVFLRTTAATGTWSVAQTPVDDHGNPYRGMDPNRLSARITPKGGGVLVGADPARSDDVATVLARDATGRFHILPDPDATVLVPGTGGHADEQLATQGGTGRVADAAYDGPDGKTELLFGALGPDTEDAVMHWDGTQWSREAIDVPTGSLSSFSIVAIDATADDNAFLLAQTASSQGDGIVLFRRTETGGTVTWEPVDLGPRGDDFAHAQTPADGISGVAPLTGRAQPLTVSADGLWIDGTLKDSGGAADFTLYADATTGQVQASWCDAHVTGGDALCDHPLGFAFGRRSGYRSFAFTGDGTGTRIVTDPLDPDGDDDSNLGTYVRFDGSEVRRMPGGGGNGRPSGAFSSVDAGWLEGPVQVGAAAAPNRFASWPVAVRAPFTSIATEPGRTAGDPQAKAIAVGADGGVARYTPGKGWTREFLLTSTGAVSSPTLRSVTWPEAGRAYAVGDTGAMWLWRAETGLWEKDGATPLGFDGNLLGVGFDPGDPSRGYAVGRQGVLLRYDKTWEQETLPAGFDDVDFTSIAFAGHQALVAAGADVLENEGGAWHIDQQLHDLLATVAAGQPQLYAVAALPDGGAVVAGRDIVLERDSASAPWRVANEPIPDQTAVAAAAFRQNGQLRAILSVVPSIAYPPPLQLPPDDPDVPPPVIPAAPLPGDGYVLRETADGWQDEQRTSWDGTTSDRPAKSDPIAAFAVGPTGTGWAVGGWSGQADDSGRGDSVAGGNGSAVRRQVQTAAIFRYGGGASTPPGATASAVPLASGVTTFAVAGHAQCESACALLANQGLAPDRNLAAAVGEVAQMAKQPNGPKALLYTGGRTKPGTPQSMLEGQRYAQLLGAAGGTVPVYPAMSAGDDPSVFESSFGAFAAPFGTGATPGDVSTANVPGAVASGGGARTHYAFDTTGNGPVRVIVIDNSSGSLAGSDDHQNPSETQEAWLVAALADAKQRGIPAIVMGSRDLNSHFAPALNVATDADHEAQILRDGGASAYLFERPEENRTSTIPSGDTNGIPEFGTGTLGYRSSVSNTTQDGQPDALFGDTGFLLVSVDGSKRDPATNRAPASARLIPVIQDLTMNAVDGTLLRRSHPSLFLGLGRRPVAGDRWGDAAADGSPNPPGSNPYVQFPPDQCRQANCSSRIVPEYTFHSSEPDIANFVAQDPASTNLHKPFQDPNNKNKPVLSAASGLVCPYNAGTTVLSVSAGGFTFSQSVTVQDGAVLQPCGTTRLSPEHQTTPPPNDVPPSTPPVVQAAANAAPPPPPPPPALVPVVHTPVAKVANKPAPKLMPPPAFVPAAIVPTLVKPVKSGFVGAPPPPSAAAIARPTPPGGATVRVFEEKREEEAAPEQSSASAVFHIDEHTGMPDGFLYGLILLAAFAGTSLMTGSRRRTRRPIALADTHTSVRHRSTSRRRP